MTRNVCHIHADQPDDVIIGDRYGDKGGCIVAFGRDGFLYLTAEAEDALLARLQARQKVLKFPARSDNLRPVPSDMAERAVALVREVADAMTAPSPDSAA